MIEYTADDALKMLDYLDIRDLSDEEKSVFKERWDEFYEARDGNLIMATWTLYASALPHICKDSESQSYVLAQQRDRMFAECLKSSGIDKKINDGIPLNEILGINIMHKSTKANK